MRDVGSELEYYLGYRPSVEIIAEAEEWLERYPSGDLAEWATEMAKIGAL